MTSTRLVSALGLVALVALALALGGCTALLGSSPLVLALLAIGVVATTGCLPTNTPCCAEVDEQTGVGRVSSCSCPAFTSCNYDVPYLRCPDVAGGCVSWVGSLGTEGENLECVGEEGPTSEQPCCMDDDGDGLGVASTCRCPLFGECAWGVIGRTALDCGGGTCAVVDVTGIGTACPRPDLPDASETDAGVR